MSFPTFPTTILKYLVNWAPVPAALAVVTNLVVAVAFMATHGSGRASSPADTLVIAPVNPEPSAVSALSAAKSVLPVRPPGSAVRLTVSPTPAPSETSATAVAAITSAALPAPAATQAPGAPQSTVLDRPWFADRVGDATRVVSVVGRGGSNAILSTWHKRQGTWTRVTGGVSAKVGRQGISRHYGEHSAATPAGVFSLPSAFGRQPDPGSGLRYTKVGNSDWWVSDVKSPAYNTHQRCAPGSCSFDEAAGENLGRAGAVYNHAVVMGVNTARKPGGGSAFFLHITSGSATAGCVAISSSSLKAVMRWLRPGSVIALSPH